MVRRSVVLLKISDERRFRFRARFESPTGAGRWKMEDNIFKWLDQHLGKDNYAFHADDWEGHARDCYALYFDDHTIIDDLLKYHATIENVIYRGPRFHGEIARSSIETTRTLIAELQDAIVNKLNVVEARVIWAMGKCSFGPGRNQTAWEIAQISRINELTEVCSMLSTPTSDEVIRFTLEDRHRGALEICLTVVQDFRPPPKHLIGRLRGLLNSLVIDTGENDVRTRPASK